MPNQTPLDPSVVALTKAIGKRENGGKANSYDFSKVGADGERGAYQMTPSWIATNAPTYLKGQQYDPQNLTAAQQDELAYRVVEARGKAGLSPAEIASEWNSGSPTKYKENWKGTSPGGVKYDTPGYVNDVAKYYQENLGTNKQSNVSAQKTGVGGNYSAPLEVKPFEAAVPPENKSEKGIVRKGLEFLFPILEDKERTGLQTAADLGLSALTLVPGLGAPGLGVKAGLLGGKVALKGFVPAFKGANALKGAAAGYGVDVLSNVSEGETGKGTLMPGLGTVLGGAGGALLGRAKGTTAGKSLIDEHAMDEALDIVAAPARKANIKAALKQRLGGRAGLVGSKVVVGADTKTKNAAEAIKDMVVSGEIKAGHTVEQNANAVLSKIETLADDLETKLTGMEIQPLITGQELQKLIKNTEKKFKEDEILVGDAGESAKRIFNKFIKYLPKGRDITAIDILKARKALDAGVRSSGRGRLFDPKIETAISIALREIRQGANDLLASKAPDVAVKEILQQQSRLYDALEAITENGWKDAGKGAVQRYMQRHPNQKALLQYGVGGGVGAGVLNYFDGQ